MSRFIINPKVNNSLGLMDVVTVPQGGTGVTVDSSVPGVFDAYLTSDLNTASGPVGLDGNGKVPAQYFPTGAGGVLLYDGTGLVPGSTIPSGSGIGTFIGLTGPSAVIAGQTVTYTITNYDAFTTYSVSVSAGSVSVDGATITYTAPTSVGNITLTVNGKSVTISVVASLVNTPAITSPTNGATNISLKPTFTKTPFSVTGSAQTQTSVRWELSTSPTFTTLTDSYEGTSNYTSWTPSVTLSLNTVYYVRVRDQGNLSGYSAWSPVVSFTTTSQVNFVATLGGASDDQYQALVKLGGYLYAAGYQLSQGQGNWDALIVKYDTNGNLLWQRGLGGSNNDYFAAITTDGTSIYAAGYQYSQGQGNWGALIVKYDTNGNLLWQRSLGRSSDDIFTAITTDGTSIYAAGYQASQAQGSSDALIVKYDANGNLLWQRGLGGSNNDRFNAITTDGTSIYAAGYQLSQGQGNSDALIVKYDTNGNLLWQRGLGGSNNDYFTAITTDGTFLYAAGHQLSQGQGSSDALIVKYDTNGNLLWQRGLGGSSDDYFTAITTDGTSIYAAGYQASQAQGSSDALIVKYDTNGNLLWQRGLGGSNNDRFNAITTDGTFLYAAGHQASQAQGGKTYPDALLVALPVTGNITLGVLTGAGLTGLSWTAPTLTAYTPTLTAYTTTLTATTPTLTATTPTLTTYTTTLTTRYSTF